jgi:hypothetical protein
MHVPLVVEQRCDPVCPLRQSVRPGSRHVVQLVVVHDTPPTLALQACVSVVAVLPVHMGPPPLGSHVGVLHERLWLPVRSQVPGIVWAHALHEPQVVAPHAPGVPERLLV